MEAGSQKLKKACHLLQQTTVNYSDQPQRHIRVALTHTTRQVDKTEPSPSTDAPPDILKGTSQSAARIPVPDTAGHPAPHQHPKVVHPCPNGRVFMPDSGDRHTVRHSESKSPGLHKKHLITNRVKQTRNNICFK